VKRKEMLGKPSGLQLRKSKNVPVSFLPSQFSQNPLDFYVNKDIILI